MYLEYIQRSKLRHGEMLWRLFMPKAALSSVSYGMLAELLIPVTSFTILNASQFRSS